MPAQTVMRLIKYPVPMYKPTAWRSRGRLHVTTTQNTRQTRQLRHGLLESTRCLSLLKAKYQSRSNKAMIHQNNSNMTRAFSGVERSQLQEYPVSDRELWLLFSPWLRQERAAVEVGNTAVRHKHTGKAGVMINKSATADLHMRACWAFPELCTA